MCQEDSTCPCCRQTLGHQPRMPLSCGCVPFLCMRCSLEVNCPLHYVSNVMIERGIVPEDLKPISHYHDVVDYAAIVHYFGLKYGRTNGEVEVALHQNGGDIFATDRALHG